MTYLLPFLTVFSGGWRDVLALVLFLAFIGILYVNTGMIYVNPLLAAAGYHLMAVRATTDPQGKPQAVLKPQLLLIRRRWLQPQENLTVREVMPDTLVAFPSDDPDGP